LNGLRFTSGKQIGVKMKRILTIAIAMFAVFAAVAAPANAGPTPSIALWVIDTSGQMYSVNSTTGTATAVGSNSGVADTMAAALDPTSGRIIVITESCHLYSANTATGAVTDLAVTVTPSSGPAITYCTSMSIDGDGLGWASVTLAGNTDHLASFNLTTGVASVRTVALNDYYDAMFFDPTNGNLYGQNDSTETIFSVDKTTGADTNTGTTTSPYSYNIVMDNQGNYWANSWDSLYKGTAGQWSSGALVGPYTATSNVNCLFTSTNFWPVAAPTTPGLANTGTNLMPEIAAASILLITGLALAFGAKRRRKA
jgi:hypothetical protein